MWNAFNLYINGSSGSQQCKKRHLKGHGPVSPKSHSISQLVNFRGNQRWILVDEDSSECVHLPSHGKKNKEEALSANCVLGTRRLKLLLVKSSHTLATCTKSEEKREKAHSNCDLAKVNWKWWYWKWTWNKPLSVWWLHLREWAYWFSGLLQVVPFACTCNPLCLIIR